MASFQNTIITIQNATRFSLSFSLSLCICPVVLLHYFILYICGVYRDHNSQVHRRSRVIALTVTLVKFTPGCGESPVNSWLGRSCNILCYCVTMYYTKTKNELPKIIPLSPPHYRCTYNSVFAIIIRSCRRPRLIFFFYFT